MGVSVGGGVGGLVGGWVGGWELGTVGVEAIFSHCVTTDTEVDVSGVDYII